MAIEVLGDISKPVKTKEHSPQEPMKRIKSGIVLVPQPIVPNGFCLPGNAVQLASVKGAFHFGTMIRYLDHNDALGGFQF